MNSQLSPSAEKVQRSLKEAGFDFQVIELPQTTRSAQEAAREVGCLVEQIVKSLIFRTKESNRAILILVSGANRVNEIKVSSYLGEPIEKADAEFVRDKTGFSIGGVPPVCHREKLETLVDEDLLKYEAIWAAAGTPNAVFSLSPPDLLKITGGKVISVK